MALVRCPIHKIPYNDENPRGCPACALDKEGGGQGQVMQELARAVQTPRRTGAQLPPMEPPRRTTGNPAVTDGARRSSTTQPVIQEPASPVTPPPRLPVPRQSTVNAITEAITGARLMTAGVILIVVLGAYLVNSTRPHFADEVSPPATTGLARPLPVDPNDAIGVVFAILGAQSPQTNPTGRSLARYAYGSDLVIDALNNTVYAITFTVSNRSWRGIQIGMNQQTAIGAMALLGQPREPEPAFMPRADTVSGYLVFRSLDMRPRRTYVAEVRPPNGCFDVAVDIQPRAIGVLTRAGRKYSVMSPRGGSAEWVATRLRAVSRSVAGPYSGAPAC